MTTNVKNFLEDLEGGVFAEKIGRALSDVAAGVVDNGKAGKVVIQLDVKQIATSHQVNISHKLGYVKPTRNGKISEENTTETPMYVGSGGDMTLFPEGQDQLFDRQGKVPERREAQ